MTAYGLHQDPPNFTLDPTKKIKKKKIKTVITPEAGKVTCFSSNYASTGMRPKNIAHTESQEVISSWTIE